MSKEVLGTPTMKMTIIPLGVMTANRHVYDFEQFQNPPLPCLVQMFDGREALQDIDLAQVVGLMDNLRVEPQGNLQALVGDFHHMETPPWKVLQQVLESGIQCTPIGQGRVGEGGVITDYTLLGFGIYPAPPPTETERPV